MHLHIALDSVHAVEKRLDCVPFDRQLFPSATLVHQLLLGYCSRLAKVGYLQVVALGDKDVARGKVSVNNLARQWIPKKHVSLSNVQSF